jgi:hypothetical protein
MDRVVSGGLVPQGGWSVSPRSRVMNKQPTLEQDLKKRRSRPKLHDLPPKKGLKGGSPAQSAPSENGLSVIPTSLHEFLKRDSLSIKSH